MRAAWLTHDGPLVEAPAVTSMTRGQAQVFDATCLAATVRRLNPEYWTVARIASALGKTPRQVRYYLADARAAAEPLRRQRRGA